MSELEWDGRLDGDDEYCYRPETTLIVLADTMAKKHGLDPALVCALCEVGSGWNPWAIRYKPGDLCMDAVCVHEDWSSAETEQALQNYAFGLMQIKGNIARERGFDGWLTELCDPATNLEWGCRHIVYMIEHARTYGIRAASAFLGEPSTDPEDAGEIEIWGYHTEADLFAAWNGGKARIVDGKYVNEDYVKRVVRAMANYQTGG